MNLLNCNWEFNWQSLVDAYEREIWEAIGGESMQSTWSTHVILRLTWAQMQFKWKAKLARLHTWKDGLYESYVCLMMFAKHHAKGICSDIWKLIANTLKTTCIQTHLSKKNGYYKLGGIKPTAADSICMMLEIDQNSRYREVQQVFKDVDTFERIFEYKIVKEIPTNVNSLRALYFNQCKTLGLIDARNLQRRLKWKEKNMIARK